MRNEEEITLVLWMNIECEEIRIIASTREEGGGAEQVHLSPIRIEFAIEASTIQCYGPFGVRR